MIRLNVDIFIMRETICRDLQCQILNAEPIEKISNKHDNKLRMNHYAATRG